MQLIDHEIDYIGKSFGIFRYPDESLSSFKKRLNQIVKVPPNTTTLGMTSGCTIELGGSFEKIITIQWYSNNHPTAFPEPGYICSPTHIHFYTDLSNNTKTSFPLIDWDHNSSSDLYMADIVSFIDSMHMVNGVVHYYRSSASISEEIAKYIVPLSSFDLSPTTLNLRNQITNLGGPFIKNSLTSNSEYINEEVSTIEDITKVGEYVVDSQNGIIWTYPQAEEPLGTITFQKYSLTTDIWLAPVKVLSLIDSGLIDLWSNYKDDNKIEFSDYLLNMFLLSQQADKNLMPSEFMRTHGLSLDNLIGDENSLLEFEQEINQFQSRI